jgi:hypothetical protein
MAYEPKPNQCGLFTNDRHPDKSDLSGAIEIQCPKCRASSRYWVNGWHRTAQSGKSYIQLTLKLKENADRQEEVR